MNKNTYLISLKGCDDTTYNIMQLTDEELKIIEKVASKTNRMSACRCQPVMRISLIQPETDRYEIEIVEERKREIYNKLIEKRNRKNLDRRRKKSIL